MEGLLFPIIMLTVTLVGGGIFLLVLKHQKPKHQSSEESAAIRTAQEFINVRDVKDKYLYTKDGLVLTFLRVHGVSIDPAAHRRTVRHSVPVQVYGGQPPGGYFPFNCGYAVHVKGSG